MMVMSRTSFNLRLWTSWW